MGQATAEYRGEKSARGGHNPVNWLDMIRETITDMVVESPELAVTLLCIVALMVFILFVLATL